MSILSKWGFRAGNCGGSDAVANPRIPNGGSAFFGTLRDELAAGWQVVKTRWELVEERMAFESWAVREMTRVPAVAEIREEIIEDDIRKVREVDE